MILWECKRAANWSGTWIGKLADDVAEASADLGVIVSEELPASLETSGLVDSIWVTGYPHASTLAAGLREAVMTAWRHRLANAGREDTAAKVYDYIATGGFADRYAAAERALDEQVEVLRREKRYYERAWAQREQQIEKTRANLAGIVADLQTRLAAAGIRADITDLYGTLPSQLGEITGAFATNALALASPALFEPLYG